MKPATVALLSAALLLLGTFAARGIAAARETDWQVEEDMGLSADVPLDADDEFQASIPAETGTLPPGDATGRGDREGSGPPAGRFVDPEE